MLRKISVIIKDLSVIFLNWQSNHLQKKLIKRLGYTPKNVVDGCTVDISQAEKDKRAKIDLEVRGLLKQFKNDVNKVAEFLTNNNIKIYRVKHAKDLLEKITEDIGFITERHGYRALFINLIIGNGFKLKTEPMIIVEDEELSIYNFIHYLHKWYAMKEGMPGYDEKSQILLQKFNLSDKQDKLIGRLSIPEIENLRHAIARDVQSIDFMSQYSRENSGSKQALEKMKTDGSINI